MVQDKLYYALHGYTVVEVIYERADDGNVSHKIIVDKASREYQKFIVQRVAGDYQGA